jgi:hypothetical protein
MQQYTEQCPSWVNTTIDETLDLDAHNLYESWLARKIELDEGQLYDYICRLVEIELDCEKRTVEMIKLFNLPIDLDKYVRYANFTLMSYFASMYKRAVFTEGRVGSKKPNILKKFPTTLIEFDRSKKPTKKELKIFDWFFEKDELKKDEQS